MIVVAKESGESEGSMLGGQVRAAIGPASQERLDEAFGLAVGARAIGPGSQMTQAKPFAGRGEAVGDVAGCVVGHDAGDGDAVVGLPEDQSSKEAGSCRGSFVG